MHIIPDNSSIAEQPGRALALSITPAAIDADLVAELVGDTLLVNIAASAEDQLAAIADAVSFLSGGRPEWGQRVRHLAAVTS